MQKMPKNEILAAANARAEYLCLHPAHVDVAFKSSEAQPAPYNVCLYKRTNWLFFEYGEVPVPVPENRIRAFLGEELTCA
eukprot:24506-Eustigmatos_ZCMA.PRE.1